MNYECKAQVVGSNYKLTHFIDGKKVMVRGQEDSDTFNGFPFTPNQHSDWSFFQVNELIKLDMLVYKDDITNAKV